ncbi:MAG: hypothetical protein IPI54_16380 [Chitinophagaceae bacterium]|nr:hypothetical protein [Chitinophagaceae bacterium]
MKFIVVLFSVVVTGLVTLLPGEKNVSGTWVMEQNKADCSPAVIRIKMNEGNWEGNMDIPGERVFDRSMYSISVKGDSVFIKVSKEGNAINAAMVNENTLEGNLVTDAGTDAVRFTKL